MSEAKRSRTAQRSTHDEDFWRSRSPLHLVDQITAPLFISHSSNDQRIKVDESIALFDWLQARKHDVEFMELESDGHVHGDAAGNIVLYERIEVFLRKHLLNLHAGGLGSPTQFKNSFKNSVQAFIAKPIAKLKARAV